MDPDLVRATGLWKYLEHSIARKAMGHLELRFRVTATGMAVANGHLFPLVRMVPDGLDDPVPISIESAADDGNV